jgi:hypothetical protein
MASRAEQQSTGIIYFVSLAGVQALAKNCIVGENLNTPLRGSGNSFV